MFEDFADKMRQASESFKDFHSAVYKAYNNNYHNMRLVSSEDNIAENEEFFMQIPEEYEVQYVNALTVGLNGKEAYGLLRETYGF